MTAMHAAIVPQLAQRYLDAILGRAIGHPRRVLVGLAPLPDEERELPNAWMYGLPDEPSATMDVECGRQVLERVLNDLPRRGLAVAEHQVPGYDQPGRDVVLAWRFDA
ncbi:MAG TPA: hypothetical protein VHX44_16735 [Planctomycetota bacterium]|nr:hypothetical protein [Planctomycetota bacterium]